MADDHGDALIADAENSASQFLEICSVGPALLVGQ
jgi:hypothetical protein